MRVAFVLVTHLRAKVEMYRHPHLKYMPVLIVDRGSSEKGPLVVDRFPKASGVTAGMTLEQAFSRHPAQQGDPDGELHPLPVVVLRVRRRREFDVSPSLKVTVSGTPE